ncbi:TON1 Recruiting Motif 15 [Hibiscus trionum]|uniref:TON1 Recruiting Motif 15 n=1 Tax=Hibiscus trionum TaxID=183268 RepID=A0A9W7IVE2_HIBTR|nr:TON1 Recruiting Motif 15 [Hibiscus trionum]
MGKRSNRCPLRYEKDQLGCMWGLVTMFDFRHGRMTQRLLSDRRRENENDDAVGMGNSGNKLDMSTSSGEEKAMATDTCKQSVKKLLEEEMSREQVTKKEVNNTEHEAKEFGSGEGDNRSKIRKRKNKTRKKSSGNSLDVDAAKNLVLEVSCQHKSEQQTTSSLDVDSLVEEFCQEIDKKRNDCVNNDQPAEGHTQRSLKSSGFEERLSEAIKFLVSQKLISRNQLTEGGELQASKEVMDALQVLSLDEELFLKLLRDPNSLLVKYVKDLPDVRDEESKPLAGSNISEQELVGLKQSNEPVNRKQRNFFRGRSKSQERDSQNKNKVSEASTRIVVLKPGPTCSQMPETGSSHGSLPEPKHIIRHREPNEKVGSHFFLAEIKRKWKHAMGREQHRIPTNEISKRVSSDRRNPGDAGGFKEYITMSSPTKDHFFIERVAKPSTSVKKGERTSKLKGSKTSTDMETNFSRHSNIYIQAKKHLSEMLTNGDKNVDLSSRQVKKTLGRILSLPDYNSSPVSSPNRSSEPSFITPHTRFAGSEKSLKVDENHELNNVSHRSQAAEELEIQLCISDNKTGDEVQGDDIVSDKLDTFVNDDREDQNDSSTKDETSCGGAVSIVKETEMMVQEETKLLDASSVTSDSSITRDDKIVDVSDVRDEKQYLQCSKQDLSEEDQQSFSPLASPSNSPIAKKVEGLDSVGDIQERPSPVSVLEPIFADEVISPASIRSISGETSIQPLRIRFEEHGSSANNSSRFKTCMDNKESIFEHVKAVLQASSFDWDELYIRSLSSDQLLDPLLLDEVEYLPNQLCHDKKLLFDCINEVLVEVCGYYFGSPGVSFVKTNIRPLPNMKNTIEEIWQRVYWHVLPMPLPRSLDQVVRKDLAKKGTWMDLRLDADFISVEIGEDILDDLVEDTITSYINVSPECEYHAGGQEE